MHFGNNKQKRTPEQLICQFSNAHLVSLPWFQAISVKLFGSILVLAALVCVFILRSKERSAFSQLVLSLISFCDLYPSNTRAQTVAEIFKIRYLNYFLSLLPQALCSTNYPCGLNQIVQIISTSDEHTCMKRSSRRWHQALQKDTLHFVSYTSCALSFTILLP